MLTARRHAKLALFLSGPRGTSRNLLLLALWAAACGQPQTLGRACPAGYAACENSDGCCRVCDAAEGPCIECSPDTVECWSDPTPRGDGSIIVTCDAAGTIADTTPCRFGCSQEPAACHDCYAGLTHCLDDALVDCSPAGAIVDAADCSYGCSDDANGARCNACTPSATECHAGDLVVCDAAGNILSTTPCQHGCTIEAGGDDRCNDCPPGLAFCDGDIGIQCSASGRVASSVDCAAELFCTVGRTCAGGACGGGSPRDCDDGNACTADLCDDTFDLCVNYATVVDGALCEDGSFCTVGTTCAGGACGGGGARSCNDGDPCTADTCDEASRACLHDTDAANGAGCDDGLLCTVNDTCQGGVCAGDLNDCNDGNPCTADACDTTGQVCVNDPTPLAGMGCDDGLYCTVGDTCANGQCTGSPRDCADGELCTADSCNEVGEVCVHDPVPANGLPCDDGLGCTSGEKCDAGACTGGVVPTCNDGNPCTADSCDDAAGGCVNDPAPADGNPCEDGSFCTIADTCSGGACLSTTARSCNDGNACTIDSCDEIGDTCVFDFSSTDGQACADALFCTEGTTCTQGICGGGTPAACDDGKPCTADSCDEAGDTCIHDAAAMEDQFCGTELICCTGSCIPSDASNCGACGNVCPAASGCTPTDLCFHNTCIDAGIVVITELMINPQNTADSTGEWMEVYNATGRDIDIGGWQLRDDGSDLHTVSTAIPVVVPAGGFAVLVRNNDPALNCSVTGDYQYASFELGNVGDEVVLRASGCEVDRVVYPNGFASDGNAKSLDPGAADAVLNDNLANWCNATTPMACGDDGTPGTANPACP